MGVFVNFSDCGYNEEADLIVYSTAIYIPLSFASNLLVLVTLYLLSTLRTPDNYFIAMLSLADLLVGVVAIPITILSSVHPEMFKTSYFTCMLNVPAVFTIFSIALSMLMLLNIDRCIAICYPFWYNSDVTNVERAVVGVLLLAVDITANFIIFSQFIFSMSKENGITLNCTWKYIPVRLKVCVGLGYLLKFIISLSCSVIILITVCKRLKKLRAFGCPKEKYDPVRTNAVIHITTMILSEVLWLPLIIMSFSFDYCSRETVYLFGVVIHMTYINSCLCGIICAATRRVYRSVFVFILTNRPCEWSKVRSALVLFSFERNSTARATPASAASRYKTPILSGRLNVITDVVPEPVSNPIYHLSKSSCEQSTAISPEKSPHQLNQESFKDSKTDHL